MSRKIGYTRVSTINQDSDSHIDALTKESIRPTAHILALHDFPSHIYRMKKQHGFYNEVQIQITPKTAVSLILTRH